MSASQPPCSHLPRRDRDQRTAAVVRQQRSVDVFELLAPGSFVTLDNHPDDLPPFQVIHCRGGRCLVRQQAWGQHVQWEVEHQRLHSA